MFSLDFDRAIKEVLASSGQMSFKRRYRLDVDEYSWVKDYVRDQKTRKEIASLQEKITATQQSLIDRDELRVMFEADVEQTRQNFLELLKTNLSRAQRHESGVIVAFHEYGVIRSELPLMALSLVSSKEIADAVAGLPEGVKREKVGKDVEAIRGKIASLNQVIEKELSPQERWFYSDTGKPMPYPAGCRWSKFVEGWRQIVARFDGKADIEGCALATEDEFAAFHMLELDRVLKLPPLREPWKR